VLTEPGAAGPAVPAAYPFLNGLTAEGRALGPGAAHHGTVKAPAGGGKAAVLMFNR